MAKGSLKRAPIFSRRIRIHKDVFSLPPRSPCPPGPPGPARSQLPSLPPRGVVRLMLSPRLFIPGFCCFVVHRVITIFSREAPGLIHVEDREIAAEPQQVFYGLSPLHRRYSACWAPWFTP